MTAIKGSVGERGPIASLALLFELPAMVEDVLHLSYLLVNDSV